MDFDRLALPTIPMLATTFSKSKPKKDDAVFGGSMANLAVSMLGCIGLGVMDPSCVGSMAIAMELLAKTSLSKMTEDDVIVQVVGGGDGGYFIPGIGKCKIYVYSPDETVVCCDDGDTNMDNHLLRYITCTVHRSLQRTGRECVPTFVFEVDSRPALALFASIGCHMRCKSQCTHKRLCFASGKTWVTASDLLCGLPHIIKRRFEHSVGQTTLDTGAGGCKTMIGKEFVCLAEEIGKQFSTKKGHNQNVTTQPPICNKIASSITNGLGPATTHLKSLIGLTIEELNALMKVCNNNGFSDSMDTYRSIEKGSSKGGFQCGDCVGDLEDFGRLRDSGWKASSLIDALPGCLAKIVRECTTARHPKYPERLLVGVFLSRMTGIRDNRGNQLYEVWKSLFEHPEAGSMDACRTHPGFDSSKYGASAITGILKYVDDKKLTPPGCPYATKYKYCPHFQNAADEDTGDHKKRCFDELMAKCGCAPQYITPASYYRTASKKLFDKK
jgi:hypothetical protein